MPVEVSPPVPVEVLPPVPLEVSPPVPAEAVPPVKPGVGFLLLSLEQPAAKSTIALTRPEVSSDK